MDRNYTSTNADALSKDIQGNNKNSKIVDILSPPRDLETLPLKERERERETKREREMKCMREHPNIFIVGGWWKRVFNGINYITERRHILLSEFVDGMA